MIGWIRGVYPTENTAKSGENEDLFVMTDAGRIVAAARINQVQVSGMLMQTGNIRIFCRNRLWFCIRWS